MARKKHAEPLGPANITPLEVTQELVALYYMDDPTSLSPMLRESVFHDGLTGKPAPEPKDENDHDGKLDRAIWEAGALAAHLIAIGGQK